MSDNSHATVHDEAHTGPIKNPKQLALAVLFSFVAPIFIIIGLVYYVTSANKPAAGSVNVEKAIAERIQKVGSVEIRDANRALKSGEEVFKTVAHSSMISALRYSASRNSLISAGWDGNIKIWSVVYSGLQDGLSKK